jgi:hypothetical protein
MNFAVERAKIVNTRFHEKIAILKIHSVLGKGHYYKNHNFEKQKEH